MIEPLFKNVGFSSRVKSTNETVLRITNPSTDILEGNVLKSGRYDISTGSRIFLGPTFANPEILEIARGAEVTLEGDGKELNIDQDRNDLAVTGKLNNLPTVLGNFINGGTLTLETIRFRVEGSFENTNFAIIDLGDAAVFARDGFTNNGKVIGAGTVNGMALNNGIFNPGKSPGTITVEGDFTQGQQGMTILENGGTIAGEQHDQLVVTGNAVVDGEVMLKFIDGFAPIAGQEFGALVDVAGSTDVNGAQFNIQNLAPGFEFDITPTASGFMFTALTDGIFLVAGDYNNDGTVGAADYSVWRDSFGAPAGTLPNEIDCGAIGEAQYATWKANFGNTSGSGAKFGATVPEPTAALFVVATAIFSIWGRTTTFQVPTTR